MSRQITVRVPEELVQFVDAAVKQGREQSRASAVTHALQVQQRRALAERDVAILRAEEAGSADDLEGLAEYARSIPLELD